MRITRHRAEQGRRQLLEASRLGTPTGYRTEDRFPVHPQGQKDVDPREPKDTVDITAISDWENTWGNATWGP